VATAATRETDGAYRQTIMVWSGTRRTRKCDVCHEPITFIRKCSTDRWMPFESDSVALRLTLGRDNKGRERVVAHMNVADVHFVSCPRSAAKRRR
jgi:E3 ubiquitin-protein ligase DOA10